MQTTMIMIMIMIMMQLTGGCTVIRNEQLVIGPHKIVPEYHHLHQIQHGLRFTHPLLYRL